MPRTRTSLHSVVAGALASAVALAGCGQADDVDALAIEACELYHELTDPEADGAEVDEAVAALTELQERAEEAGHSDAELEAALERNCPELPGFDE